jgi:hypothetical protein
MNKMLAASFVLGIVMNPALSLSDINCQPGENLVTGNFGVNPVVSGMPPMLGYPGAETAELVLVQLAWLAGENEHRDQELTSTDYVNHTQTDVGLYDGEFGSVTPGLREAELLETSNFERGQLDVAFCMPDNRFAGLLFAIYENLGTTAGLQVSPFFIEPLPVPPGAPPPRFRTTAVLNQSITEQVAREFNDATAEIVRRDIELVTGVYPPRYLVESIFQREISATFKETLRDAALFHNPNELTTVAANMLITANHLVVSAPHSVTRVEMNGVNVLDENNQIDLRNAFLPPLSEIEYGEIGVFVYEDGDKRPALLINKSPCGGLTVDAPCGTGGIIALYCEPSPLHTVVEFWNDDTLEAQRHNVEGNVELDVPANYCDNDWTIRDLTCFRDEIIYSHKRGLGNARDVPARQFCQMPGYDDGIPPDTP